MKDAYSGKELESLLQRLGQSLQERGRTAAIVVVGGAALNLLRIVDRTTVDIDVIALGIPRVGRAPTTVEVPAQLPAEIAEEVERMTRDLGLAPGWINTTVTSGGHLVLPPGFADRVVWRREAGLWLGLAGRWDLITLKLHAAADTDLSSRHVADLLALGPSADELETAAQWVVTQDAGPEFPNLVARVVRHVLTHAR